MNNVLTMCYNSLPNKLCTRVIFEVVISKELYKNKLRRNTSYHKEQCLKIKTCHLYLVKMINASRFEDMQLNYFPTNNHIQV